jgi:type II secretory pathway component PulM
MNSFAFALTPAPALNRVAATLRAGWLQLSTLERRAVAGGGVSSMVLVVALAVTCQASVAKGERFRAEQRQGLAGAAAEPRADQASASGPPSTPSASKA